MTTPRQPGDARFRPDLEGLRGIAVLLVVLCHARVPGAEAGFVGVDVFFVLSGFLITGLLVEERERIGRIRLGAFYARRVRRILPAAIFVLASTLLAAGLFLSPLDLPRVVEDGLAAGLSLSNVRFALNATDYFAPIDASPLLHYWSLAVEEQFYLLWPVMLIVIARLGRPRVAMAAMALVVLVGSFVLCLAMTAASGPWAYFSLPTRAWELAAGGLLALAAPRIHRAGGAIAAGMGWVGLALLGAALLAIQPTTEYPGLAAVLPTLGTVAVIASGGVAGSPGSIVLARKPLRWLGRISYSLYLWHWPVLVLGPVALGLASTENAPVGGELPVRLALALLAVVLAALTWRLVEEPFRRARLPQVGRVRGFALAGAAVVIFVASTTIGAVAAGATGFGPGQEGIADAMPGSGSTILPLEASPTEGASSTGVVTGSTWSTGSPAPAATSTASSAPSPSAQPAAEPRPKALIDGPIPRGLAPTLAAARTDDDRLVADGCGLNLSGTRLPNCVYGNPTGAVTVALVGDSHANQWFPALELMALQRGWRLVPLTKYSCVFLDLPIWSPFLKREYTECETWREDVVDRLVELRPDLVIIASDRYLPVMADGDDRPERQGVAMARLIDRIPGTIAIVVDTPRSEYDVPACLAQHRDAIERCATSRSDAFGWRHGRREQEAARLTGASLIDLSAVTCPTDPCPPIIGTNLVYRDHHHITATFARSLAADLEAALPPIRFGSGS